MQRAETLRHIIERYDVAKTGFGKRSLDRHIGRGDDADRETNFFLRPPGYLMRLEQPNAGPFRIPGKKAGVAIHDHDRAVTNRVQEFASELAQFSRAV